MFDNRITAGKLLAERLSFYQNLSDVEILAIPRGGVVVAIQIAQRLKKPLSILITKKISAPQNRELAIGAVGPNNTFFLNQSLISRLSVDQKYINSEIKEKRDIIKSRLHIYKEHCSRLNFKNKIIILVDDGVATGATVEVAIKFIKENRDKNKETREINMHTTTHNVQLILAVPVIAKDTYDKIIKLVDKIITLEISSSFGAVGEFYREFGQVSDEEVIKLLKDNEKN